MMIEERRKCPGGGAMTLMNGIQRIQHTSESEGLMTWPSLIRFDSLFGCNGLS